MSLYGIGGIEAGMIHTFRRPDDSGRGACSLNGRQAAHAYAPEVGELSVIVSDLDGDFFRTFAHYTFDARFIGPAMKLRIKGGATVVEMMFTREE